MAADAHWSIRAIQHDTSVGVDLMRRAPRFFVRRGAVEVGGIRLRQGRQVVWNASELSSEPIVSKAARHAGGEARLWTEENAIEAAISDGVINEIEGAKLDDYGKQLMRALSVDEFPTDAQGHVVVLGETA